VQAGDIVTINSRKYDGTIRRSWTCRFVSQEDSLLVFEGEFESEVSHPDLGLIAAGSRSLEYYWLDRWYNVFRFYEPTGEFRNLYCNVNMPPTVENGVLDYVDLDIDVVVWPDGAAKVLDEDDFEANAETYDYPESVRAAAIDALAEIKRLISSGYGTFSLKDSINL
jgi:protein associated with RNAse G/E